MRLAVPAQVPRDAVTRDPFLPRLVHDVMEAHDFLVAPDVAVPVLHRLERVVLPAQRLPLAREEVGEEVLVWELKGC